MKGKIIAIIGPVVDISFYDELPYINDAVEVEVKPEVYQTLEVAAHLGNHIVRCIALESTEGLSRGMEVYGTGSPVKVHVGKKVLGRMLNVLGQPIDEEGQLMPVKKCQFINMPHRLMN